MFDETVEMYRKRRKDLRDIVKSLESGGVKTPSRDGRYDNTPQSIERINAEIAEIDRHIASYEGPPDDAARP